MAYHESDYDDVLGARDQTFYVVEKRSYDAICYEQNFYKQYASLDLKFILTDDNQYVANQPKVIIEADNKYDESDPTRIKIVIPAGEQYKLPVDREIFVVMTAHWTNKDFENVIDSSKLTFQNLVNKIHFKDTQRGLNSYLNVFQNPIQGAQPLILNASDSFVSNVAFYEAQRNLTFNWTCPELFANYCQEASPIITIPWLDVYAMGKNMTFEKDYKFSVKIDWNAEGKVVETQTLSKEILWRNVYMPEYYVHMQTV